MKLSEGSSEGPVITSELIDFAAVMGIKESSEMAGLRQEIVAAMRDPARIEEARAKYGQYEEYLEREVERCPASEGRVVVQLMKAAIFCAAGDEASCDEFLYDAIVDSVNSGFGPMADAIRLIRRA